MFYYKFNLYLPNFIWVGTKACRKKNFINPKINLPINEI